MREAASSTASAGRSTRVSATPCRGHSTISPSGPCEGRGRTQKRWSKWAAVPLPLIGMTARSDDARVLQRVAREGTPAVGEDDAEAERLIRKTPSSTPRPSVARLDSPHHLLGAGADRPVHLEAGGVGPVDDDRHRVAADEYRPNVRGSAEDIVRGPLVKQRRRSGRPCRRQVRQ